MGNGMVHIIGNGAQKITEPSFLTQGKEGRDRRRSLEHRSLKGYLNSDIVALGGVGAGGGVGREGEVGGAHPAAGVGVKAGNDKSAVETEKEGMQMSSSPHAELVVEDL